MILFDNKSSLRSLSCQQFLRLCSLPPHLCQTQQDHEDEAERHRYDLQQSRHCLLSLLLQDLEEDDVEQAAGGDALDQSELSIVTAAPARPMAAHLDGDECGGVDVVLLAGVRQRHADPDADGGDGAEHRHVHHRDHRPQLHTHIYIRISRIS